MRRKYRSVERNPTVDPKPDTPAPSQRAARKRPRALTIQPDTVDTPLTPAELLFCQAYLAEGFNGSAAYRVTHPHVSPQTAKVNASKLLTRTNVQAQVARNVAELNQKLQWGAEDHFRGLVNIARFDLRTLFDDRDHLLPVKALPLHVAEALDGVEIHSRTITTRRKGAKGSRIVETRTAKVRVAKRLEAYEQLGRFHNLQTLPEQHEDVPAFALTDSRGVSPH